MVAIVFPFLVTGFRYWNGKDTGGIMVLVPILLAGTGIR
jgi:hypothetical protein